MYVSKNGVTVRVNPMAGLIVALLFGMFGLVCVGHIESPGSVLIGLGLLWVGWQTGRRALRLADRARETYKHASDPRP